MMFGLAVFICSGLIVITILTIIDFLPSDQPFYEYWDDNREE